MPNLVSPISICPENGQPETLIKTLRMQSAPNFLSDRFSVETFSPVNLKETYTGQLGDLPFCFTVFEKTTQNNDANQISSKFDMENYMWCKRMLSIPAVATEESVELNGEVVTTTTFYQPQASTIITALGCTVAAFTDFRATNIGLIFLENPNRWVLSAKKTANEILNALFSWSDTLERKKIIITGSTTGISVRQRDMPSGSVNLDDPALWAIADNWTKTEAIVRTLHDESGTPAYGYDLSLEDYERKIPFSGTYQFGGSVQVWSSGYLMTETNTQGTDSITTSYSYGNTLGTKVLLQRQSFKNSILSEETQYSYSLGTDNIVYLSLETENIYEIAAATSTLKSTRYTRHTPMYAGFFGHEVSSLELSTNKITLEATSISRGAPGGEAAAQYENQKGQRQISTPVFLNGDLVSAIASAPDYATKQLMAAELNWLNGKTQEKVTVTVYNKSGNNHIIRISEAIKLWSNTYFVDNINVEVNPSDASQTISLVRWY